MNETLQIVIFVALFLGALLWLIRFLRRDARARSEIRDLERRIEEARRR